MFKTKMNFKFSPLVLKLVGKFFLIFIINYFLFGCTDNKEFPKKNLPELNGVGGGGKGTVLEVTTAGEKKEIPQKSLKKPEKSNSQPKVTFIELGSVKCVPCKMMQPIMKEIETEYAGQVKVVFYDVWEPEGRIYAEKYQVRVIPTQVFLDKNGQEFSRHMGFFPKEELVKVLKTQGVE